MVIGILVYSGVKYTLKEVDIFNKESKSYKDFVEMQPSGNIPYLFVKTKNGPTEIVGEQMSDDIVQHLVDKHEGVSDSLFPAEQ